jgi:tRNA-splicing ligase RtcB (3'-phosphate/5'-hydroxy nucleic acid ligase)
VISRISIRPENTDLSTEARETGDIHYFHVRISAVCLCLHICKYHRTNDIITPDFNHLAHKGAPMQLERLDPYRWQIPKTGEMRVPGIIYSSEAGIKSLKQDGSMQQVANVATLPGIVKAALAMPDIHLGYGFPIGGVAAFDWQTGVISPGGVGYDINCGVRLATTALTQAEIHPHLEPLINHLFTAVPSGVGSTGPLRLSGTDLKQVLKQGSPWAVAQGFGQDSDIAHTEENGCLANADPNLLSKKALERGKNQLGTLGSGNHFLEIGVVDEIFDKRIAQVFGLFAGQVTVMLHSGSRGLGYQVCDDHLAAMKKSVANLGLHLPDRQLACAMIQSDEGRQYLGAMACAANYAWANRQIMLHRARQVFMKILSISPKNLCMNLLYDVCHNIAKKETHRVGGEKQKVCVVRKGATRALGPGQPGIPERFRAVGQPILTPGDMGRASYVLCGTDTAMEDTFGSTCHGAGRRLSRKAAKKAGKGRSIQQELAAQGILVKYTGRATLAEEMPEAYKDVSEVVAVVHGAGISKMVARLRPLAVVKG